jgi:4-hydroxy-2-oxoheptanedioate aldolase
MYPLIPLTRSCCLSPDTATAAGFHPAQSDGRGANRRKLDRLSRVARGVNRWVVLGVAIGVFSGALGAADAGQPGRLNRVIERTEKKEPVFGIFSHNVSTRTGAAVGSSGIDFVIIDLEHSPYDVTRLEAYLLGMIDKRQILQKGNLQPNVVPIVRIPSAGREQLLFVIKQVLDLGVFGLLVPHIDTAEDALAAVRAVRFPQMRGVADFEPQGLRGVGYGWPARYWGLTGAEYGERADVWPLDPKGELLLWLMIETASSIENIESIVRTPGVSGLFVGPSDLAFSMGLPFNHPEVEAAIEKVARACSAAGVPCGTLTGGAGVKRRLEQGFQFLAVGGDSSVSAGVQEARKMNAELRKNSPKR